MMNIKYKILSIDEQNHNFIVRYYTDIATEDKLAVSRSYDQFGHEIKNIKINRRKDGSPERCITDCNFQFRYLEANEKDLHDHIAKSAPIEELKLRERLITQNVDSKESMAIIFDKLNKECTFDTADYSTEISEDDIDKLVELVQNGKNS